MFDLWNTCMLGIARMFLAGSIFVAAPVVFILMVALIT